MRILIDLQGAQTASRLRGVGRYILNLARTMVQKGRHEYLIGLNGQLGDSIDALRAEFDGLLPPENIRVWDTAGAGAGNRPGDSRGQRIGELLREGFIAKNRPDWVLVGSLFENSGVCSVSEHCPMRTAVVLYDLIPMIYPDSYLPEPRDRLWYQKKLGNLRRADLLLSISASSTREAERLLGFEAEKVQTIGAGSGAIFQPGVLTAEESRGLGEAFGIRRPFVMYTGGDDPRKNVDRLLEAYASLTPALRAGHQLVLVYAISEGSRVRLMQLAKALGLDPEEISITGYVNDDELVALYRACKLFVFPSWHEGFGLPPVEAMRCGRAVIASDATSLPEVVGRRDALFDPFDVTAIAASIARGLTDDAWREDLERHGPTQAARFTWEATADRVLKALESQPTAAPRAELPHCRPRLAYVSPLPPEHSGIAEYGALILPELARWYEIEVIVAHRDVDDPWIIANCPVRSVDEFRTRAKTYDRIVYQFGNSTFHAHMFDLLAEHRGVVVLHDFFLSGALAARHERLGRARYAAALMPSHGYEAICRQAQSRNDWDALMRYPANLPVLQRALGIIVHSQHALDLANSWYGSEYTRDWSVVPLPKLPPAVFNRDVVRRELGVTQDELLVCSFGMPDPTKLSHRLLRVWLDSPLLSNSRARLVFVGEHPTGSYARSLQRFLEEHGRAHRVQFTGWVDQKTFRHYLEAADIAVQLRTLSRGETSAAVLDCLNHGLPTIVNAHGSLAELDTDTVWMLPDDFSDDELVDAVTALAKDPDRRAALRARSQRKMRSGHLPGRCAKRCAEAIERAYGDWEQGEGAVLKKLAAMHLTEQELRRISVAWARNNPPGPRQKQLLVDISGLDPERISGISRVVRAILLEWLRRPPEGYRVEPVHTCKGWQGYRYARRATLGLLGSPSDWARDEAVEAWPGDVFVGLHLNQPGTVDQYKHLAAWKNRGVAIWFVVYDLLPILRPECFEQEVSRWHIEWLKRICRFDGLACISRSVADETKAWAGTYVPRRERPLKIRHFHLGHDTAASKPTRGLPTDSSTVLGKLRARPSFLIVAGLAPRKGHAQALDAFEKLWDSGLTVNLVLVGRVYFMAEKLIDRIQKHPSNGVRLFWLEDISDEYLSQVYAACTALLAVSEAEGFGLPLVEAAEHGLPIVARDIPVFREIAGRHAAYFKGTSGPSLARAVAAWLELYRADKHPQSAHMPRLSWRESAGQLATAVLKATEADSSDRSGPPIT